MIAESKPKDKRSGPIEHGILSSYTNRGCRCSKCRAAATEYYRNYFRNRPPMAEDDPRHGTTNGYGNQHCRCDRCKAAHAAYKTARRRKRGSSRA